ncbi:Toluene transport system Ttg2D protein [Granulibacter bethesdensis]|nr:Toluene transport system Ttg2D protein [Granulibacter bethesdensis]
MVKLNLMDAIVLNRRLFLAAALAGATFLPLPTHAQSNVAADFIRRAGNELVTAVNNSPSEARKKAELTRIVDSYIDVDNVGRFCLGRYWTSASQQQRQQYLSLFHKVLVRNVTSKIGEAKGMSYTLGRVTPQGENTLVQTIIHRPGNAPANVQWVVATQGGPPRIVDVLAEGTSLRLTQRQDYASFLQHHNQDLDTLISAISRQAGE